MSKNKEKEFSYDMKSIFDAREARDLKISVTDKIGTPPSVIKSTSRSKIPRSNPIVIKSTPKIVHQVSKTSTSNIALHWNIPVIKIPIIPRYE
jgi:hypothetical protein